MTLDCVKCNQTIDWEGDEPEPEDCLCGLCLSEDRDTLKDRVAELESERGWLLHEIKWAVDGKSTWALESVLRVAGATAASVCTPRETLTDEGQRRFEARERELAELARKAMQVKGPRTSEAVQKQPIGPCVWHRPVRPDDTRCPRGTLGCVETHPYDLQRPNEAKPEPTRTSSYTDARRWADETRQSVVLTNEDGSFCAWIHPVAPEEGDAVEPRVLLRDELHRLAEWGDASEAEMRWMARELLRMRDRPCSETVLPTCSECECRPAEFCGDCKSEDAEACAIVDRLRIASWLRGRDDAEHLGHLADAIEAGEYLASETGSTPR